MTAPATTCPSWCQSDDCRLIGDGDGHFHDGPFEAVAFDRLDDLNDGGQLFVKPTMFVGGDGTAEPPMVEIQGERYTLGRLLPATARDLAAALISAAGLAEAS